MTSQEHTGIKRIKLLVSLKKYTDAAREAHLVLAINPRNELALAYLGYCKFKKGNIDGAITDLQEAIGLKPEQAFIHFLLTEVHLANKNIDAARDSIHHALTYRPDNAIYVAMLANIFIHEKNWNGALSTANKALALDPNHIWSLACRAMALNQLERFEESEATIRTGLSLDPNNETLHALLGQAKFNNGNITDALDSFRESMRLDPTKEAAKAALVTSAKSRSSLYFGYLKFIQARRRMTVDDYLGGVDMVFFLAALGLVSSINTEEPSIVVMAFSFIITGFATVSYITEPITNLIYSSTQYWRYTLDQSKLWLTYVTGFGVVTIITGLVSLFIRSDLGVALIIFGFGTIATFGCLYEVDRSKRRAIGFMTVLMIFGTASLILPLLDLADFVMMEYFGIAVMIFRWFTDGPTVVTISYWR